MDLKIGFAFLIVPVFTLEILNAKKNKINEMMQNNYRLNVRLSVVLGYLFNRTNPDNNFIYNSLNGLRL